MGIFLANFVSMNISTWIKNSSNLSLTISVGLHLFLLTGFGLWQQQHPNDNIIKIPSGHTISLGGFNVRTSESRKSGYTKSPPAAQSITSRPSSSSVETVSSTSLTPQATSIGGQETSSTTSSSHGATESAGALDGSQGTLTAKQKYFADFRTIIESKKQYPPIARMRGMEGVVVVAVTIKNNGEVSNHKIIRPSGFTALDEATLNLIKRINMFKSFPADLSEAEIELKLPIAYKLNG